MNYKEALRKVNSLTGWSISIGFYDSENRMSFLNISLDRLLYAWITDGLKNPADDAYVYGVVLSYCTGAAYVIDCGEFDPLTFEDLMLYIQERSQQ